MKSILRFSILSLAMIWSSMAFSQSATLVDISNENPCSNDGNDIIVRYNISSATPYDVVVKYENSQRSYTETINFNAAGTQAFSFEADSLAFSYTGEENRLIIESINGAAIDDTARIFGRELPSVSYDFAQNPLCEDDSLFFDFTNVMTNEDSWAKLRFDIDGKIDTLNASPSVLVDTVEKAFFAPSVNFNVQLTKITDDFCSSTFAGAIKNVTVNPTPNAEIIAVGGDNAKGFKCEGTSIPITVEFENVASDATVKYEYTIDGVPAGNGVSGAAALVGGKYQATINITPSLSNVDGNIDFNITEVSTGTCTANAAGNTNANFDVHEIPSVSVSTNPLAIDICEGDSVILTADSVAGSMTGITAWLRANVTGSSFPLMGVGVANNDSVSFGQSTDIVLDSVSNDFCVSANLGQVINTVNITNRPRINITTPEAVCAGSKVNLEYEITSPGNGTFDIEIFNPFTGAGQLYAGATDKVGSLEIDPLNFTGTFASTVYALTDNATGCSADTALDVRVDNSALASNDFDFVVQDSIITTVNFAGGVDTVYSCFPTTGDSIEVVITIDKLLASASNYQFGFNETNLRTNTLSNFIITAENADFVPAGPNFEYSFKIQRVDSFRLDLASTVSFDFNGNTCNNVTAEDSLFGYINADIILSNYDITDNYACIGNGAEVSADLSEAGNYNLSFTVYDENNVAIATPVIASNENVLVTTFADLGITAEGDYLVRLNSFEKIGTNVNCTYNLDSADHTVAFKMLPEADVQFANAVDTVCDGINKLVSLEFLSGGEFDYTLNIARETTVARDTLKNLIFNASDIVSNGVVDTSDVSFGPDSTSTYSIYSGAIVFGDSTCAVDFTPASEFELAVVQGVTSVNIEADKLTSCAGDAVVLTYDIEGGANHQFDLLTTTLSNGTETLTPQTGTNATINVNPLESVSYTIQSVKSVEGTNECVSNLSDAVTVNVQAQSYVKFTGADSVICEGGDYVLPIEISAIGDVQITFDVIDNADGSALPQVVYNYTMVGDTDQVEVPVVVNPGQSLTFSLVSLDDETSPSCVAPISGDYILNAPIYPEATLTYAVAPCFGGQVELRVDLNFGYDSSLVGTSSEFTVDYALRFQNGDTILMNTETVEYNGTNAFVHTVAGLDQDTVVELISLKSGDCLSQNEVAASINVDVNDEIRLTSFMAVDDTVCNASNGKVIVEFNQSGIDFDVYTSLNGGGAILNTIQSGDTLLYPGVVNGLNNINLDSVRFNVGPTCTQTFTDVENVFVLDQPTVVLEAISDVCEGDDLKIPFNTSSLPNTPLTVYYSDDNNMSYMFDIESSPRDTATLTNVNPDTYVFNIDSAKFSASSEMCPAIVNSLLTESVEVHENPVFGVELAQSKTNYCSDDTVQFNFDAANLTNYPYNVIYTYNGTEDTVVLNSLADNKLRRTFDVSGTVQFVKIEEVGGQMCASDLSSESFALTIDQRPEVVFTASDVICEDTDAELRFEFTGDAPFLISVVNLGTFRFYNTTGTNDTIINVSPTDTTEYIITSLTDQSSAGCASADFSSGFPRDTVKVIAKPNVDFVLSEDTICNGQSVDLTVTLDYVEGTNDYNVYYTQNGVSQSEQILAANNSGTFNIPNITEDTEFVFDSIQNGVGCTYLYSGITQDLTVFEDISLNISSNKAIVCANADEATITIQASGRAGEVVKLDAPGFGSFNVPVGGQVSFNTGSLPADSTFVFENIRYSNASACTLADQSFTQSVSETPTARLIKLEDACAGDNFDFEIEYLTGSGNIEATFLTNKGASFTHTGVAGSTYSVSYNVADSGATEIRLVNLIASGATVCQNSSPMGDSLVDIMVYQKPTATIDANPLKIVSGGESDLTFVVGGHPTSIQNIKVDYTANGGGVDILDDGAGVVDRVSPNDVSTPEYIVPVTPTVTTLYEIAGITQFNNTKTCTNTSLDNVTVEVISGKEVAISGSGSLCISDSLSLFFSLAQPTEIYDIDIEIFVNGVSQEIRTLQDVEDGKVEKISIAANPTYTGSVTVRVNAWEIDGSGVKETDPNTFDGEAVYNVSSSKIVEFVSDTIGCFGQSLPIVLNITGSGEFTIPYRSIDNGNIAGTIVAGENDNPVTIDINPNNLDLGLHTIVFGGTVLNSDPNSCPIDTVGNAFISVKDIPTAEIDVPNKICEGELLDVLLDLTPDSLMDVTYSIETGSTTINSVADDISGQDVNISPANFRPTQDVTITISKTEYSDLPTCTNNTIERKTVVVDRTPTVQILENGTDTLICFGTEAKLRLAFDVENYPVSYQVEIGGVDSNLVFHNAQGGGDTTLVFSPASTTIYTVKNLSDANSCASAAAYLVSQEVDVLPEIGLNKFALVEDTICHGEALRIELGAFNTPLEVQFRINNVDFVEQLPINQDTIYSYPGIAADQEVTLVKLRRPTPILCEVEIDSTLNLVARRLPSISMIADKSTICKGDSVRYRISINADDSVNFNISDQNPIFDSLYTNFSPGTHFTHITPLLELNNEFTVDSIYYSQGRACQVENIDIPNVFVNDIPNANIFVAGNQKDTVICEGEDVELTFTIEGVGQKNIYLANDQGFVDVFSVNAGVTQVVRAVNPFPNTGLVKYFITKIENINNGTKCEATLADTVNVMVNPTPTVDITADLDPRCLNDATPTNLTLNFNGNGPFTFDYIEGNDPTIKTLVTDQGDSDNDGRLDRVLSVKPAETTTYRVIRIQDNTVPNACVNNSGNAYTVRVNEQAEAEIFNSDDEICEGESVDLEYYLRGEGPMEVVFQVVDQNGLVFKDTVNNLFTGVHTYTLFGEARDVVTTEYAVNILSVTDDNLPTCTSSGIGVARVSVHSNPKVNDFRLDVDSICAGDMTNLIVKVDSGLGTYRLTYFANGVSLNDTLVGQGIEDTIVVGPNNTTRYRPIRVTDVSTGCLTQGYPINVFDTLTVFNNPTFNVATIGDVFCEDDQVSIVIEVDAVNTPNKITISDVFFNGNPIAAFNNLSFRNDGNGNEIPDTTIVYNLATFSPGFNGDAEFTFGEITDGREVESRTYLGCTTPIDDTLSITVNPTPTAEILLTGPNTICQDQNAELDIAVTGNGEITVIVETYLDATNTKVAEDTVSGLAINSPLNLSLDANYPQQLLRFEIREVKGKTGAITCLGNILGSPRRIRIKGNPMVSINPTDTTMCEGDNIEVNFNITPASEGPYDFYYVLKTGDNLDTTFYFNQTGGNVVEFITLEDSAQLYIPSIVSRTAPACFTSDSVGININVNPKANATIIDSEDLTYCADDQAGFNISLEGVGLVRAYFRDVFNPSAVDSFKAVAGEYFVPVDVAPGTVSRFEIIAVDDQSSPRCTENNFSSFAKITKLEKPTATLSGDFTICEGESSSVNIALTGSFSDSITVYFSDVLNNTIDTSYSARVGFYSMVLAPSDSAVFKVDSIAYNNFGCTVTNPANTDSAIIDVRPTPAAEILVDKLDYCDGQDVTFTIDLEYEGPHDVVYSINNGSPIGRDRIEDKLTVTVPAPTDTLKIVVESSTYRAIPQCTGENLDSLVVNVNDSLEVVVLDTLCNDVATGFGLDLQLTGGQPSSYTYEGSVALNARDTTPDIPNGIFNVTISDNSGCPDVILTGDKTCDCISFAGSFTNSSIDICEDDTINLTANYQNNFVLDADDSLIFVIQDQETGLGNILQSNSEPKLPFNKSTMLYDVVYYVTAIAADSLNGFIDTNDRCLDVSNSIPVVFRERSTAEIELLLNDSGEVCVQNPVTYRFKFTGNGPFVVQWLEAGVVRNQVFNSNVTSPLSSAPIAGDGEIEILSFTDQANTANCNTVLNSPLQYTARPLPDAVFDASDETPCGFQEVTFDIRNVDPLADYYFIIEGEKYLGESQAYTYDVNGTDIVKAIATNEFGCMDSTERTIDVNVPKRPNISISGNSVANVYCVNDQLTFTSDAIFPADADEIVWFQNGTERQRGDNNEYTFTFTNKGTQTIVARNRFDGCSNSDTVVFEIVGPEGDVISSKVDECVDEVQTFDIDNAVDVSSVDWTFSANGVIPGSGFPVNVTFPEGFPSVTDQVNVSVVLESEEGCQVTEQFAVTIRDLNVELPGVTNDQNNLTEHCLRFEDTFTPVNESNTDNYDTWTYNFGDGTGNQVINGNDGVTTYTYPNPGTYTVTLELEDKYGCKDQTTIDMTIFELPEVTAIDTFACLDEDLFIQANGAEFYEWGPVDIFDGDPGNGDIAKISTLIPTSRQVELVGIDGNQCRDTLYVDVTVYDLENPRLDANYRAQFDTAYKIGYELPVDYTISDDRHFYNWTPATDLSCSDCPNPTVTTMESRNYVLEITDVYGCFVDSLLLNIEIEDEASLDMPDAFSPNGDKLNDLIYPDGWGIDNVVSFQIFDRQGSLLWNASGSKQEVAWDGFFNGQLQPVGTYTYRVVVNTLIGTELIKTGKFELIR